MKLNVMRTDCTNPYDNLATEEFLTMNAKEDEVTLFLWQNAHTIVIGRNQNPWKECNVEKIKEDDARLSRRMSGGGAVYHDMGNLNFTFIARDDLYDISKQTDTILLACRILGISAEKTGRNDLLVDGRKFSGHAYFSSNGYNYHHGTIMMDVDFGDMPKYLRPSAAKLKSKGVDSVRSRVTNLKDYLPKMSRKKLITTMQDALIEAFGRNYGGTPVEVELPEVPQDLKDRYASEEWRFGTKIPFEKEIEHRFEWGEIDVQLHMQGQTIDQCRIYSDALEFRIFDELEKNLIGCKYDAASIVQLGIAPETTAREREVLHLIADAVE
ncbi:MAG: lipoate--protein ligase [Clostridiales bacterium]|nr:lipoate--protein ligase [Candidatus Crickella equi]